MNVNAIPQVYISPTVVARAVHDCKSERAPKRTADANKWRNEVYECLLDAAMDDMAEQFISCSDPPTFKTRRTDPELPANAKTVFYCPHCKDGKVYMETCHLRICPECSHRLAARLVARYVPALVALADRKHHSFRTRKIELTTPFDLMDGVFSVVETHELNVDEPKARLRAMFSAAVRVFDAVLDDDWRKSQGLILAAEYGLHGRKLHFHVLHYGQFIPYEDLSSVWESETGGACKITWIRAVRGDDAIQKAIAETLKYCVKFWKETKAGIERIDAVLVPVLASVLAGQRRVRTYGLLYKVPDPEDNPLCCNVCGMGLERWTVTEWNVYRQTGWTPQEYDEALAGELNLRLGNKSGRSPPEIGNRPPPIEQKSLPGWGKQAVWR